jgi:hypothetical protein
MAASRRRPSPRAALSLRSRRANRFGETGAFYLGEFLGVVFLFAGFVVSAHVLGDIRIPFTGVVLLRRDAPA